MIRLHPTKVRVLGVNGESLLHALGLRLDDMLDLSKSAAARVKGDDIYLDPTKILPPPAINGRLTSVRIEGVLHEFSTLPGVIEDVTEIVLNLKQVRLKLFGDGPYLPASHPAAGYRDIESVKREQQRLAHDAADDVRVPAHA